VQGGAARQPVVARPSATALSLVAVAQLLAAVHPAATVPAMAAAHPVVEVVLGRPVVVVAASALLVVRLLAAGQGVVAHPAVAGRQEVAATGRLV